LARVTRETKRLLDETKKETQMAKDEISSNKTKVENLAADAERKVTNIDELVTKFNALGEENRKLVLAALANVKEVDLGTLRETVRRLDMRAPAVLHRGRCAASRG
jgi:hypothetical protein